MISTEKEIAVNLEGLTPEQIEKTRACKTPKELLDLAREEGIELTDEQLEQVSGGSNWDVLDTLKKGRCPRCDGNEFLLTEVNGRSVCKCQICGTEVVTEFK